MIQIEQITMAELRQLFAEVIREEIPQTETRSEYLTVKESAMLLGVTTTTVHTWIARGEIKSCKIGKTIRIKRADIEEALQGKGK